MAFLSGVGAVAPGLVGRLASSAAQRLGSLIFQKICRTIKIENALRTGILRNPGTQQALSDFETVIGSRYGKLTQQLDSFLRELERTGILNAMFEHALLSRDSDELKRMFVALHRDLIGPNEGDAEQLYKHLWLSFSVTIKTVCKDRIILDALQIHHTEIAGRIANIDDALASINQRFHPDKTKLDAAHFSALLLKVVKSLQTCYRAIRVETNKGPRSVEITKIYIPSSLRYRSTPKNAERLEAGARVIKASSSAEAFASPGSDRSKFDLITYADLRGHFNRAVILGDPGGGKSTLCQHLCYDLAKQTAAALQITDSRKIPAQLQKCPIRIVLRQFETARTFDPQLTIYEYIVRDWANFINAAGDDLRLALDYLLSTGRAVLAFDGLDEILVPARRRDYVDLVIAFCNQFPLCPAIITSRLVGYDDARLSDDFDELVLERFNDDEVKSYAGKFFSVVGGHTKREADRLADVFFRQTTQNASDLRRNPLLLGLMSWIFNSRRDVPSNRPEIYRECAILMFERWDPDRDIKADIPSDFDRLQLFSELASKIYGRVELSAGVELDWLEKQTRSYFERVYETRSRAFQSASALVKFITGRAWVMSEVGDRVFAFTHQTFLEYFFARHLDEQTDSVAALYQIISPKFSRREWDMVAHLALQIKTYRNLRRQNEAIDLLVGSIERCEDGNERSAIVSFAARATEYLAGSESNIKRLVSIVFSEAIAADNYEESLPNITRCCQCVSERREFVKDTIVILAVAEFKLRQGPQIDVLLSKNIYLGGTAIGGLPDELIHRIRSQLTDFVSSRLDKSSFFAIKGWEWYGLINKGIVSKFGLGPYYKASFGAIGGVDGLSSTMLCASRAYHRHYKGGPISQKKAMEALAIFGSVGLAKLPLDRKDFQIPQTTAPIRVWLDALDGLAGSLNTFVGALFCMILTLEIEKQIDVRTASEIRSLDRFLGKVLSRDAIRKLEVFPKFEAIVRTRSVLDVRSEASQDFSDAVPLDAQHHRPSVPR